MKILALYSIKGGVGKTAASVNLAYLAAKEGAPTLLCDLDPQGSASYYFRIRPSKKFNKKKFLSGRKLIDKNIKGTDYENLDLLASDLSFRNLDIALDQYKKSKKRLSKILEPFEDEYEYIFIDCPPNITLVSENIFYAADHVIVPIIPTTLSVLTYEKLMKFFKDSGLNRSKITPFFSMVELRKKMHQETMSDLRDKDWIFLRNYIPYLSEVEKMGLYREPVVCFSHGSPAGQSYVDLWREIKGLIFQ